MGWFMQRLPELELLMVVKLEALLRRLEKVGRVGEFGGVRELPGLLWGGAAPPVVMADTSFSLPVALVASVFTKGAKVVVSRFMVDMSVGSYLFS